MNVFYPSDTFKFDNLQLNGEYWRPIRDEEKIEVMMQMLIDLHSKFERLKDI